MVNENIDFEFRQIIKNEIIEVPEVVRERIDETISSLPERRHTKKARFIAVAVLFLFGAFLGLGFISPAAAQILKTLPIVGFIFETAGDPGQQFALRQGESIPLNQTVTDNGIKLTLTEGIFDGARISIGYILESFFGALQVERPNIWVNGKKINFSTGYSAKVVGPTKIIGVMTIDPTEELPEDFDMQMIIDAIGIVPGKWEFKFPVTLGKSRLISEPGVTKSYQDLKVTVKKVILAPSATNLKLEVKQPRDYYGNFRLYDDRGMMLQNLSLAVSGTSKDDFDIMQLSASFAPAPGKPKYLVLKSVANTFASQGQAPVDVATDLNVDDLPLTISQGEIGKIIITKVEYLAGKTRIHYEVQGSDPYNQAWLLWVRDSKGKDFDINAPGALNPIRKNPDKYEFIREFSAYSPGEKLKVVTRTLKSPPFIDELEIKIPLEW